MSEALAQSVSQPMNAGLVGAAGRMAYCEQVTEPALKLPLAFDLPGLQTARADLQLQNDRLRRLLKLTQQISAELGLGELLRTVSAGLRELMHCEAAQFCIPEPTGSFRVHAFDFPRGKGLVNPGQPIVVDKNNPASQAMSTLKPIVVSAPSSDCDDQFTCASREFLLEDPLNQFCFVPLAIRGQALGVLVLSRQMNSPFTANDVEFLNQASPQIALALENALAYQEISELKDKLAQEKLYLEEEIRSEMNFDQIVGTSPVLREALQMVETVAASDSTILLFGETGTGKELIARAIHDRSQRRNRTFIKINCAAIPSGLLESELFGHERGAFTGAISQKIGRFELAHQGTLFLDEIGDIPLELQPKLLRALQEREFERLGSTHTKRVDVRLVAATNRNLERMVQDGQFRSDLYYRLNVIPIRIPSLRERPEDIPLLVRYFTQKYARRMQKQIETIPAATLRKLVRWHWPGNVRELENLVERAVVLTRGSTLAISVPELGARGAVSAQPKEDDVAHRERITRVLKETNGRVGGPNGAAARLGLKRTTLITRMKKLGIETRRVF